MIDQNLIATIQIGIDLKLMKNKIVKCVNNTHEIYNDNFKQFKIKKGKLYKCVDELKLTSSNYYIPKYASLEGIIIISGVSKYGYFNKPGFPKECFVLANKKEIIKYKAKSILTSPINFVKIIFSKLACNIMFFLTHPHRKIDDVL
jgi:hypothetical protein